MDILSGNELITRFTPEVKEKNGTWTCSYPGTINLPKGNYRAKLGLTTSIPGQFSQNSAALSVKATD
jgi:hypothetical protein